MTLYVKRNRRAATKAVIRWPDPDISMLIAPILCNQLGTINKGIVAVDGLVGSRLLSRPGPACPGKDGWKGAASQAAASASILRSKRLRSFGSR
jgi:hypothetical protein